MAEDRGQRSEDGRAMRDQMICHRTEVSGQRSDVRRTEDGCQTTSASALAK